MHEGVNKSREDHYIHSQNFFERDLQIANSFSIIYIYVANVVALP